MIIIMIIIIIMLFLSLSSFTEKISEITSQ